MYMKNRAADLSIIIVNYRSWDVLRECLYSFQEYPPALNYEVIVVDNDSQDDQFHSFQRDFPDIRLLANLGNYGFSHACNLGADEANADYLLFLNPDTCLTELATLETMLYFAKQNSSVGITSCRRRNKKGTYERDIAFLNLWLSFGWLRAIYRQLYKKSLKLRYPEGQAIWYPDWVSGCVVLISCELFKQVDKWSENDFWMYSEDMDLCKKVHGQGKKIALLRQVELKHAHGGSTRKNIQISALTKSEVIISRHVYIQKHSKGFNCIALHALTFSNAISTWLLRSVLSLPLFWTKAFKANLLILSTVVSYYLSALTRKNWKSSRLPLPDNSNPKEY